MVYYAFPNIGSNYKIFLLTYHVVTISMLLPAGFSPRVHTDRHHAVCRQSQ